MDQSPKPTMQNDLKHMPNKRIYERFWQHHHDF